MAVPLISIWRAPDAEGSNSNLLVIDFDQIVSLWACVNGRTHFLASVVELLCDGLGVILIDGRHDYPFLRITSRKTASWRAVPFASFGSFSRLTKTAINMSFRLATAST